VLKLTTRFLQRRHSICVHPNGKLSIHPSRGWADPREGENGTKNEAHRDLGKDCGHLEPNQESVISKSVISDRKSELITDPLLY
jgi:hypothetical protein